MMKLQKGHALVLVAATKSGKSVALESAALDYAKPKGDEVIGLDVLYLDGERTRDAIGLNEHVVRVKCCPVSTPLSDALAGETFDVLVIDCLDSFSKAGITTVSEIAQRHDCIVITAKQAPQIDEDERPACGGPCECSEEAE